MDEFCPFCKQLLQPIHKTLDDFYFCRTCWTIINLKLKWKVNLPYERPKNT
jgi:hypothetical protein